MDKLIKELRLAQSETKKHMEKFYKENNTNQIELTQKSFEKISVELLLELKQAIETIDIHGIEKIRWINYHYQY